MKPKIICIVGPTASGKTGLSIELAKKIDAEIISADSMQIYKKLDIGTAKIKEEEKEEIKHHLIDICDINEKFSVAEFKKMCYDKIEEILSRKKQVIIVGGTGLYINAVVDNMSFDEFGEQIKINLVKKYKLFVEKDFEEDFLFFSLIELKNKVPIKIKYKKIHLLGDKVDIQISDHPNAQLLAYMAQATGLGTMNQRGYGFINVKSD